VSVEEGTSKPIIANTTETEADADGIVTVFLNDLVTNPAGQAAPETTPPSVPHLPDVGQMPIQSTSNDDGVDELLTSINRCVSPLPLSLCSHNFLFFSLSILLL